MLRHIRVVPLAAESLGVRSMCTYVETNDVRILLDGGVSLCPVRCGLAPHPQEFKAIAEARVRIAEAAEKAEFATISHYHYDHVTPSFEDWLCNWTQADTTAREVYEGKKILAKNPREQINYSQRERAWMFQRTSGRYATSIEAADGKTFRFGSTEVRFSVPVPHGSENSELGWVVMTTIECSGEIFLFAPDVQGPMAEHTVEIILGQTPSLLMVGGPPLYLTGLKLSEEQAHKGLSNIKRIVKTVPHVIIEHHLLRDEDWREKTVEVFYSAYEAAHTVQTASEYLGKHNVFLEARRKKLYEEDSPTNDFKTWTRQKEEVRKHAKPPI